MAEEPNVQTPPVTTPPAAQPAATAPPVADNSQPGVTRLSVDIPTKPPELIVGKFKDQAAFEAGIRDLYQSRKIPLPEGRELIGEKGRWNSVAEAEAEYKVIAGNRLEPEAGNPLTEDVDLVGLLTKSKVDPSEFSAAWLKNKKIDDKHFEAIKKNAPWMTRKLAEELTTSIYESQQLKAIELERQQKQAKARAFEIAGGQEQWNTLRDHFLPSLPEPIKADLLRRLESIDLYEGAVEELNRMYTKSYGGAIAPMVMGSSMPTAPGPITTTAELIENNKARKRGDKAAIARFNATPEHVLRSLQ